MQSSEGRIVEVQRDISVPPVMNGNFIAPFYEPVEHFCFGTALEQRRNAFLNDIRHARHALSCGEGDGRFVAALLQADSEVHATAVDASPRMVEIARQRVGSLGDSFPVRTGFHCAEVGSFCRSRSYDLIATHFFLDCFSTAEAEVVIATIASWAEPKAKWLVSEFAQPEAGLAHLWTGAVIRSLYAAFRATTGLRVTHLPDYRPALASAGFKLRKEERGLAGLLVSELWERGELSRLNLTMLAQALDRRRPAFYLRCHLLLSS
jgi:ubiquinone/menaquinone biosynthesis C-methylase UbiE